MFELKNLKKELPEMNAQLMQVTTKINHYHQNVKNSIMAISMILSEIAEKPNDYLYGSGFSSLVDYTETIFGYKKAYTYKLIKISKFITITDKNGKKLDVDYLLNDSLMEVLLQNDNFIKFDILKDSDGFEYGTSQLLELIPLSKEQIEENLKDLDSSLSCKELRAVVKNILNPAIELTETDSTESTTDSTESTTEEPEKQVTDKERIFSMLEICSGMENEEIKGLLVNVFQKALKKIEK